MACSLLLAGGLAGCTGGETGDDARSVTASSAGSNERSAAEVVASLREKEAGEEAGEESEDIDPATATNPDGTPIAEAMPYEGMPEELLDCTWMGEHDEQGEVVTGGKKKGAAPYSWFANNGERIYTVYVRDGEVIDIAKFGLATDYWTDEGDTLTGTREYPNLDGTGAQVKRANRSQLEDPTDYDSPEDYADSAESYFKELGSDDPWNDAYAYWEKKAG